MPTPTSWWRSFAAPQPCADDATTDFAIIDGLVDEGIGDSRSAVIRQGVHHLADSVCRANVGRAIAESYRAQPQSERDDDLAMANAMALTEAEPW